MHFLKQEVAEYAYLPVLSLGVSRRPPEDTISLSVAALEGIAEVVHVKTITNGGRLIEVYNVYALKC